MLHFAKPEAYASIQNNTFIVSGEPETKTIKDLLPDILQQLGPKQHKALKDLVSQSQTPTDDVPTLVETPADLNKPEWSNSKWWIYFKGNECIIKDIRIKFGYFELWSKNKRSICFC